MDLRRESSFARFAMVTGIMIMCGCTAQEAIEDDDDVHIMSIWRSEMDFEFSAQRGHSQVAFAIHRIGPRMPSFVRDPEIDSPYEADLIVRNRYGFPFLMNSLPIDPDTETMMEAPTVFDHQEQIEDLQLAIDAVEQLRSHPGDNREFHWELRSLHYIATGALESANDVIDGKIASELTFNMLTEERSIAALLSTYTHKATIRWANCCVNFGQHSAVLLDVYNSTGAYIGSVSTRNHGREASDPTMSTVSGCPRSWGGRSTAFPAFQPYVNTDTDPLGNNDGGGCSTSYGLTSGTHVCNDDSQAQYWNLKYNTNASWATCGDSTLRTTAPTCD